MRKIEKPDREAPEEETLSPARQELVEALAEHGPSRARFISEKTGRSYSGARWLLSEMEKDGQVRRLEPGKYALPGYEERTYKNPDLMVNPTPALEVVRDPTKAPFPWLRTLKGEARTIADAARVLAEANRKSRGMSDIGGQRLSEHLETLLTEFADRLETAIEEEPDGPSTRTTALQDAGFLPRLDAEAETPPERSPNSSQ